MKSKIHRAAAVAAACVFLVQTPAVAQESAAVQELPDPGSIELPDLSVDGNPKAIEEGYKFFYFHNLSVSFEEAYRDIADCRSHLQVGTLATVPTFIPWREKVAAKTSEPVYVPNSYGLVGAAIAAIIAPKLERGYRNSKLRLCMEPRGYARYPVSEAAWETLNQGDEATLLLMQAKIASGPTPDAAAVTEAAE